MNFLSPGKLKANFVTLLRELKAAFKYYSICICILIPLLLISNQNLNPNSQFHALPICVLLYPPTHVPAELFFQALWIFADVGCIARSSEYRHCLRHSFISGVNKLLLNLLF